MPRRAYIAELNKLTESVSIAGILGVKPGDDDGEFKVTISPDNGVTKFVIFGLIPDLSEYPSSHEYHLFGEDDAPAVVGKTIEALPDTTGRDLSELLSLLSKSFVKVDGDGDATMEDSQELDDEYDDFEADYEDEDEDIFGIDRPATQKLTTSVKMEYSRFTEDVHQRIKSDLRAAYTAGFKVGYHGALLEGGNTYVAVSCRVSKLGISEEAMRAWELDGTEYLVLLIQYPMGYKSVDQLKALDAYTARTNISFRVGAMKDGNAYKPNLNETIRAFAQLSAGAESQTSQSQGAAATPPAWREVFISKPLNVLFNERFVNIMKYRYMGMPWQGAERFYNDVQGKNFDIDNSDYLDNIYTDEEVTNKFYPHLVMADHLKDAPPGAPHSLPLLAMQFLLRHFVRCPDFCLVCHCKLDDDLEAIKPYVCNKDLCLFQYMNLGFGPSIEHEIITQPYVVDLLTSFCYTSAIQGRLAEFPSGLGLSVPPTMLNPKILSAPAYNYRGAVPDTTPAQTSTQISPQLEARYDANTNELIFHKTTKCPFRAGKWFALRYHPDGKEENDHTYHGRVIETTYWPTVKVSPLQLHTTSTDSLDSDSSSKNKTQPESSDTKKSIYDVHLWNYDVDFDSLSAQDKRSTIVSLLDRLPPVKEMREYLQKHKNSTLDRWKNRMPEACLQVLRWIIASNRACIVQVDNPDDTDGSTKRSEERVFGMKGWMQFRFAMGAPDKERRFLDAVQATKDRLGLKYPTIFAWHGSPLHNWHSIIREGLHFKDTLHGRAYGHGVYFSHDYNVSMGYSGMHFYAGRSGTYSNTWPNSALKISTALSLNEIVNAPNEFVNQSPYLVVQQLDWIQTRYLFVQIHNEDWKLDDVKECKPSDVFVQDPSRCVQGASGKIEIPITAISRSRRGKSTSILKFDGSKRLKFSGTKYDPIDLDDDDNISVSTEPEDREILLPDDGPPTYTDDIQRHSGTSFGPPKSTTKGKQSLIGGLRSFVSSSKSSLLSSTSSKSVTDFTPGELDYSTLQILPPPPFATSQATLRLQRDYQALLKTQNSTPLSELGWYTDPNNFGDNVYQWIVELHSFEETLPLAKQLKDRGMKSVVLEMRFGANYPHEPPFVRVIKPRFLSFNAGGGGHVTAGGSICMELLTNSGWLGTSSIESVLLQVRMAICSREPKPAQLEGRGDRGYGVGEAIDAYVRACNVHGWRVPQGFREMALGGEAPGGKGYY